MKKTYPTATILSLLTGIMLEPPPNNFRRITNLVSDVVGNSLISSNQKGGFLGEQPKTFLSEAELAIAIIKRNHSVFNQIVAPSDNLEVGELMKWYKNTLKTHNLRETTEIEVEGDFSVAPSSPEWTN